MAVKKPEPVKAAVNKWDDQLAAFATAAAEQEAGGGGNVISTRGGRLSFQGNDVPGNKMNVIVIDAVAENHLYTDRFDPDNPSSPVCFAFGDGESEMAPHELSAKPQCATCARCPHNQFGSADIGKGKACKNIRRLGLITEDSLEDVAAAEVAELKIPVTSVKNWRTYVQQISNTLKRPPFAVVTEISIVPDAKTQFKINFKLVGQITDGEALQALMDRKDVVRAGLARPYQPSTEPEPEPSAAKPASTKRKY